MSRMNERDFENRGRHSSNYRTPDVEMYDEEDDYEYKPRRRKKSLKDVDWNLAPDDCEEGVSAVINIFGYFFSVCGLITLVEILSSIFK